MSTDVSSSKEAKNVIPSGFPAYRNHMLLGFAAMTVLFVLLETNFDQLQVYMQLPPSPPEYCPSQTSSDCWRADLFAFEVVSGIALSAMGLMGVYSWHFHAPPNDKTAEDRLFAYHPQAHRLTALGTTFQLFDLAVSWHIPEQRQPLFLAHHIMAALVSWCGLNNQYFHYYGIFYLGCSEISTIPLVIVDLAKFFPPLPNTLYEWSVDAICAPLFALSFTYYRIFLWYSVSSRMFADIVLLRQNGRAEQLRPGRSHVLYVMMGLNLLLGILQWYWWTIILRQAKEVVFGSQEDGTTSSSLEESNTNQSGEDEL